MYTLWGKQLRQGNSNKLLEVAQTTIRFLVNAIDEFVL